MAKTKKPAKLTMLKAKTAKTKAKPKTKKSSKTKSAGQTQTKTKSLGKALVTKSMNINEIISLYPNTMEVFFKYGFHCIGCQAAAFESLDEGAKAHGMSDETITQMVKEMNEMALQEKKFKP